MLGTAYVQIVPKAEGIKGAISNALGGEVKSAGAASGKSLGANIVSFAKKAIIAGAIGKTVMAALNEGAALQQSYLGGLDTLYGDAADKAREYARAASEAGISMNTYSEQAVSFGAALKSAYGGDATKAIDAANQAILDMADNSAKMGTDLSSIQMAYQGFAKQNYTMLDNLKLGYGGTKAEMERLLEDAGKLSGQEYDISNLSDVYEAIHVIQQDLGITGTTAEEAANTISGSFGSMKAAFSDFMGNLALGEDVGPAMENLVNSAVTFLAGNLLPAIGNIMASLPKALSAGISAAIPYVQSGMGQVSGSMITGLMNKIPDLLNTGAQMLTSLMDTITANLPGVLAKGVEIATAIGTGFINALPGLINSLSTLVTKAANFLAKNAPEFAKAGGKMIGQLAVAFVKNLPKIVAALGKLALSIGKALLKLPKLALKYGGELLSGLWSGIKSGVGDLVGKVKGVVDKITAPFKGIVDKIKGFFPISIGNIMSNIKLPHFSVSGGQPPWGFGGAGSMPKVSVSWYAKGGILTAPTLFGGGEAGDEAILPLDPFWDKIDKLQGGNTINTTITVNGAEDPEGWADRFARRLELQMRAE